MIISAKTTNHCFDIPSLRSVSFAEIRFLDYLQFIILRYISNCFRNFSFRRIIHRGVLGSGFALTRRTCRNPLLGFCCLSCKSFATLCCRKLLHSYTRVSQLRCSLFRKIRLLDYRQFIILRYISNCFRNFSFRRIIHRGVLGLGFALARRTCRNPHKKADKLPAIQGEYIFIFRVLDTKKYLFLYPISVTIFGNSLSIGNLFLIFN